MAWTGWSVSWGGWSLASLRAMSYGVVVWLGLPVEGVSILGVLLVLDVLTGIGKAWRLGKPVRSRRMALGVISKLLIILVPMVLALAAKGVGIDGMDEVATGAVTLFIIAEAYSVIANISAMYVQEEGEEFDLVRMLLSRVMGQVRKMLGEKEY